MPAGQESSRLFERSVATLIGSWEYLAGGSPGAEVVELDGAVAAAFLRSPESRFLNNAVLSPGLGDAGATLDAVERAYAERGIERFAIWVHESERAVRREVESRGHGYDISTRSMAMAIDDLAPADTSVLDLTETDLAGFRRLVGLGDGFLPELSLDGAHIYLARFEGELAATLTALDRDRDCGIYIVATEPRARRRGIGSVLTAHALAEARERGCVTASLQATPMAEALYARLGFRDLGRFDEFVPGA